MTTARMAYCIALSLAATACGADLAMAGSVSPQFTLTGDVVTPGTYNLTANITWDACWAKGQATPGGPPAKCQPVPGAGGLAASTTQPVQVNVRDIQSVNG